MAIAVTAISDSILAKRSDELPPNILHELEARFQTTAKAFNMSKQQFYAYEDEPRSQKRRRLDSADSLAQKRTCFDPQIAASSPSPRTGRLDHDIEADDDVTQLEWTALTSRKKLTIEEHPYCSEKCILGLVCGGKLDTACLNFVDHDQERPPRKTVLQWASELLMLETDTGADSLLLEKAGGTTGKIYKICLSHGGCNYTMIGKAAHEHHRNRTVHEARMYRKLQHLQGRYIVPCLGLLDLGPLDPKTRKAKYGECTTMLLMGYGGTPMMKRTHEKPTICPNEANLVASRALQALSTIHANGYLHMSFQRRNIVVDAALNVRIIDFERTVRIFPKNRPRSYSAPYYEEEPFYYDKVRGLKMKRSDALVLLRTLGYKY